MQHVTTSTTCLGKQVLLLPRQPTFNPSDVRHDSLFSVSIFTADVAAQTLDSPLTESGDEECPFDEFIDLLNRRGL